MELDIPDWLTKDFVKKALEDGDKRLEVTVEDMRLSRAVPKGNNYVCLVLRAEVDFRACAEGKLQSTTLIVKAPQRSGICEVFGELGCIDKETAMYREYLPALSELLRRHGEEALTPRSFRSSETDVLVLEDLSFYGYKMADRKLMLDYEHCVVAVKALAKFHAASVKVLEDNPKLKEKVSKEIYNSDVMSKGKVNSFHIAADEVSNWPEAEKYHEKLRDYGDKCWDLLAGSLRPREGELAVLNHGDFWTANVLFKYDGESPVHSKLIDLQVCRHGSPTIDLLNFLYSSVREDVRVDRYDDLLSAYVSELNAGFELFRLGHRTEPEELKRAMLEHEFYGLFTCIFVLPFVINDSQETVELDKLTLEDCQEPENNPLRFNYRSALYRRLLPKRLAEFEQRGWF